MDGVYDRGLLTAAHLPDPGSDTGEVVCVDDIWTVTPNYLREARSRDGYEVIDVIPESSILVIAPVCSMQNACRRVR